MSVRKIHLIIPLRYWKMNKEEQILELRSQISWMEEDLNSLREQLENLL